MRIVQIVERLEIGGLERMAVDLAIAQKAAGHHPSIYCVTHAGPLAGAAEEAGVPVVAFGKAPGFSAKTVWQIARHLRADGAEIVHTHNAIIHHYGAAAALIAQLPVVNTEHGLGAITSSPRQMQIFRAAIFITDALVFVADEPKALLCGRHGFPAGKARVILNGIPVERFAAQPACPGSHLPSLRLGTVGRMAAVKDHATLVGAFARFAKRFPQSELHIMGYGALEAETRKLAADLELGDRFQIHPGDGDVRSFLSSLDVFVLSSVSEALPLSVLEAMAAGLPVISTRVGGVPQAAPENEVAWYCPPGDPAAMADTMQAAARSGELQARGRRAAHIVAERFSIEAMTRLYDALFSELLGRKGMRKSKSS